MATALTSRRHHLSEFRDLFTALFRIRDHEVQTRVLDAINGIVHDDPSVCQCKRNHTYVDAAAQTTLLLIRPTSCTRASQTDRSTASVAVQAASSANLVTDVLGDTTSGAYDNGNPEVTTTNYLVANEDDLKSEICEVDEIMAENMDQGKSSPPLSPKQSSPVPSPRPTPTRVTFMDESAPTIRRRKRTKRIPRVEKAEENKSRVGMIVKDNMAMDSKKMKRNSFEGAFQDFIRPAPRNSLKRNSDQIAQLLNCYTPEQINNSVERLESPNNILQQMKHEYEISLVNISGLYPIHKAIIDNEVAALKRQIYVLKFRKINVHKILTEDDETPLQLAVKNNSIYPIIAELVSNGADINELDKDSNTIIHLAMMYSDNSRVLQLLLTNADRNILNLYNDYGNTALHVGVCEDKFFMCKIFLEFIDQLENLNSCGVGIVDKERLLQFYRIELNRFSSLPVMRLNQFKQGIINRTNRTNGRTALFLALSNRLEQAELMIMMLLVHFADPRVLDFNGMDCTAYALETYEIHRYNDALENATLYFEKLLLKSKSVVG